MLKDLLVLLFFGSDDLVGYFGKDMLKIVLFLEDVGVEDVIYKIYEGVCYELVNELCKEIVF